jgi:hypothetical protein
MTTIEDYDLVKRIREMFDDEASMKKFLRYIPRQHLINILLRNGFTITRASSKHGTLKSTCQYKKNVGPELARQLFDAREAGMFRSLRTSGSIATIKGGPFKMDKRTVFEEKLNGILNQNETLSKLKRNFLFTVPKSEENRVSLVLAYSNEPRPFERWIYDMLMLETVSRARYVLDLETGRISAGGRYRQIVEEGLSIISEALTGKAESYEYAKFNEDQIRAVIDRRNEPIRAIVLETKDSLGFIDQIIVKGPDVGKGFEMLKQQGIDLQDIGKVSSAETVTLKISSQGEFSDRRGDQSVLPDFI